MSINLFGAGFDPEMILAAQIAHGLLLQQAMQGAVSVLFQETKISTGAKIISFFTDMNCDNKIL